MLLMGGLIYEELVECNSSTVIFSKSAISINCDRVIIDPLNSVMPTFKPLIVQLRKSVFFKIA